MKRSLGIVTLIIIFTLFLTSCSNKTSNNKTKTIRVATTGVSFPGSYKENGKLKGFDVDVARAAAKKVGYKVKFKTTSFDGLFGQLKSGKVDAIASNITVTPERKRQFYFSRPYGYFKSAVAVEEKSSLKSINQLKNKKLAATVGSVQIQQIKKLKFPIKIKTYDDREGALDSVINGQTDGYSNAQAILIAVIKQKSLPLKVLSGTFAPEKIAITFNKDSQGKKLQKKFNNAIKKLQKDGTIAKISKKYYSGINVSKE